jgi:membrane peptidoglycan carboxypeptidase
MLPRSRFAVLAAAAVAAYGTAAWLFLLPPLELPPSYELARLPRDACRDGAFLDQVRHQRMILFVPLADVPTALTEALLRQEDAFYHHRGVDWVQALRALVKDVAAGEYRYGASTLTMQLVRELRLDKRRVVLRKLRETAYALQAERRYRKSELLEMYLNVAHWGPGIRGVGAASCYYFGLPPADLDAEAAQRMVAVLPSPDRLGPGLLAWARNRTAASLPTDQAVAPWRPSGPPPGTEAGATGQH